MTYFFETERFLRREDAEKIEQMLNEKCSEKCVLLPLGVKKSAPKVYYLCDKTACKNCNPECSHTTDISHAANFHQLKWSDGLCHGDGGYWEGDDNGTF